MYTHVAENAGREQGCAHRGVGILCLAPWGETSTPVSLDRRVCFCTLGHVSSAGHFFGFSGSGGEKGRIGKEERPCFTVHENNLRKRADETPKRVSIVIPPFAHPHFPASLHICGQDSGALESFRCRLHSGMRSALLSRPTTSRSPSGLQRTAGRQKDI